MTRINRINLHKRTKKVRFDTMKLISAGFFGAIILGAILLYMPFSNQEPIRFLDALFTSTTAICVTGLVTIVPATQFTIIGKIILLLLIQIGGLGIIAIVTSFFLLLRKKISLSNRMILSDSYSGSGPGGVVKFVKGALLGTFFVEGIGMVIYAFAFIPKFGVIKGLWFSLFHSISAFCNAGIDIIGGTSLNEFVTSPIVSINTMILIIVGGIGFTVWFDLIFNGKRIVRTVKEGKERLRWWHFTRLQLHTKLAITTTLILLILGTVLIFAIEYNNPETMGHLSLPDKVLASSFQSVTTRTAGYTTVSQEGLHNATKLLGVILMLIGGSPGGTAGGIKTTTFAMVIITAISFIRGGNETECFKRKISKENFRTGFTVVVLALFVYLTGTLAIVVIESDAIPVIDIMYETASAVGTVGLTAGLTPQLDDLSQVILIIMMYLGRIGPLTFALVFGGMVHTKENVRELPERRIIVG